MKFVHTVTPLYNGIRYNSKIRYNVNPIGTKNHWIVYFFINSPILWENIRFGYLLESPR